MLINVFETLAQANTTECPECRAEISRHEEVCEHCGLYLEPEAEEPEPHLNVYNDAPKPRPVVEINGRMVELSIDHSDIPPTDHKIPLEESKNLIKVRQAYEGALNGTMEMPEYAQRVNAVAEVAFLACQMLKLPAVRRQIEATALEGDEELIAACEEATADWLEGMKRMRRYIGSGDLNDVIEGFELVEEAMIFMDTIQDRALASVEQRKRQFAAA